MLIAFFSTIWASVFYRVLQSIVREFNAVMANKNIPARFGPIEVSLKGLMILLGLLLAFRIIALHLNQTDLFFDEAQYWLWGKEPDFGYYSKPPVLGWIIGAVTFLSGSDSPFIIRLVSPVLHTFTSLFIFLAGRELYCERTGFWAAITFATLPAVSLSSTLISTDVPLLLFWSAALYAFALLMRSIDLQASVFLGLALGLGLMSKYAMVFFVFCAGLYFLFENRTMGWRLLTSKAIIVIAGLAFLILLPNIIWNLNNGLATLSHTADNANWGASMFHPLRMLEFFLAQFGVFGPILFATLLAVLWRHFKGEAKHKDHRALLWFSVPIILVIMSQAFLSRAHANWAATAYPAASILVVSVFLRRGPWWLYQVSLALHVVLMVMVSLAAIYAPRIDLPGRADPYYRVLGWQDFANVTSARFREGGYGSILTDRRVVTAELIYYLGDPNITVYAWQAGPRPRNHYEMTRPFTNESKEPVLYVSTKKASQKLLGQFRESRFITQGGVAASPKKSRPIYFYSLSGYKGKNDE